ncbi:YciI family protein [Chitinophaga pendula]|uniref:YciI family protein n=1 Tax=Chitinophaga TaxID=79328 RepID=UPI000BB06458|nr:MULTISPECIES: YciI family protein [Chitinophaga]ASZ12836.1 hypothetical protein CK934_18680 [Chitinophaga sp. MD30]UCJ09536.1 YciI family protein [Chitinophaga pendula]
MPNYIILMREPDGRTGTHTREEIAAHQQHWQSWMGQWRSKLTGGKGLTLNGRLIKGRDAQVSDGIHQVGTEIVGGFLLLTADNLDEAVEIARGCPIYEFDGYAEVRELQ